MENTLKEKYFLTSVEGGGEEGAKAFMGIIDLIASMTGISPREIFYVEFPGGDRINLVVMGKTSGGTFRRIRNTATLVSDDENDEPVEMTIEDCRIIIEKDETKMVFSDTPPRPDKGGSESGESATTPDRNISIDMGSMGGMIGGLMMGLLGGLMNIAEDMEVEMMPREDETERTKKESDDA